MPDPSTVDTRFGSDSFGRFAIRALGCDKSDDGEVELNRVSAHVVLTKRRGCLRDSTAT